jgi:EAL domain-containing protein (putative c-di-GMP-specific phosphodiesterase class I)
VVARDDAHAVTPTARGPTSREVSQEGVTARGGVKSGRRAPDSLCMLGTTTLPDCRPLLAGPDDLTLVFQPIVDLAGATIVGYQALARFPGTSGPDVWITAAAECGLGAELQALTVHKALAAVPRLPDNTFLAVTVSPHLLGTAVVQEAFASRADLRRVVVDLGDSPVDAGSSGLPQRARGIDTAGELAAALRRGVALGQGWALGRPTPDFAPLAPEVVTLLRTQAARVWLTEAAGL